MGAFTGRDVEFRVTWRPFFLDPTLPREGKNKLDHYKAKFGEQRTAQMLPAMVQNGLRDGIKFSYGGEIANTMDAHRVAEMVNRRCGPTAGDKVMQEMLSRYMEREQSPSSTVLLLASARLALPELTERQLLVFLGRPVVPPATAEEQAEVMAWGPTPEQVREEATKWARKYRISGVPHAVFGTDKADVEQISGAQDVGEFRAAIEAVLAEY
jgi:predicted DsbA family dithiol-disulfide isomerase